MGIHIRVVCRAQGQFSNGFYCLECQVGGLIPFGPNGDAGANQLCGTILVGNNQMDGDDFRTQVGDDNAVGWVGAPMDIRGPLMDGDFDNGQIRDSFFEKPIFPKPIQVLSRSLIDGRSCSLPADRLRSPKS